MARTGSGALLARRNVRLDSFLKRNTERAVYERIRAHEPCVVLSDTVNKVYMHAVLSDEHVYLTEFPPRTLTAAVHFGRVRDIELVNDLPEFLSAKDRERCQHIRIVHVTERKEKGAELQLPPVAPPARRASRRPSMALNAAGLPADSHAQWTGAEPHPLLKSTRSASCPNPETLGLPRVPHPPSFASPFSSPPSPSQLSVKGRDSSQAPRRLGAVLGRLLRRDGEDSGEEKEAELHLYAVSNASRLYLHLQSSWNSFIIRSTLLLDPLHRRRCGASSSSSSCSGWERTAHLFAQLRAELLQDGLGVEGLYLLLQELRTAARHNLALRRLFWRSGELCDFLVQTLEELRGAGGPSGVYTADQLLLSTLIVQTLAVMFRETEVEAARINLLSAKKGALTSRLLLAAVCDPQLRPSSSRASVMDAELQVLLDEYLDATCWLLSELLLLGHETCRCSPADDRHNLTVGWILRVLQPHPHLLAFISHQAQQVVLVLSAPPDSFLSPAQAVLLFQRCRLLLACLRHDTHLAEHLRSHFREEFRYCVKPSCAEEKLPPHFPISRPTLRLVGCILAAMLRPATSRPA